MLGMSGCEHRVARTAVDWPTVRWPASTPEEQGFDSSALAAMLEALREQALPIHSMLIVRDGHVVLETYFYPYVGDTPHSWASVTKSVVSMLIGIAIEEGRIAGLDQPIAHFFPEYREALTGAKARITDGHLLKMASGLECDYEPGEPEVVAMEAADDFVKSVVELPLAAEPGTEFAYCSGGTHLLSAILTRAVGMSALEFARRRLFAPLGIAEVAWPADPQGVNHGWSNLRMLPRDMAKLGYLYLQRGRWRDERVLSAQWVASRRNGESTSPEMLGPTATDGGSVRASTGVSSRRAGVAVRR
jgi:CubicO group peptidase (beta-lactamase class C family)